MRQRAKESTQLFVSAFFAELGTDFCQDFFTFCTTTMKTLLVNITTLLLFSFILCNAAYSQGVYIEDALRYGQPNGMITPRAGALGLAYSGIADDYAALYVNPAGLTMLPLAEFSVSAQFNSYNSTATYFGTTTALNRTSPFLGHIGIALPVRVGEAGNFTIAFGYSRESDFSGGDSVVGFNTATSLVNSWVAAQNTATLDGNPAFELKLADVVNGRFFTPIRSNLQHTVSVRERGVINNLSIGIGFDVLRNVSVGISFVGTFGEYRYVRVFKESDTQNRYKTLDNRNLTDIDFTRLTSIDILDHTMSGSRLILGSQVRIGDNARLGASFILPLDFLILEKSSRANEAVFDNGEAFFYNPDDPQQQNNRVLLPWGLNIGASANISGFTISGSADICNLPAIRVTGDALDVAAIEQAATNLLKLQIRAGIGAEYEIPNRPFVLRGSYSYVSSPYVESSLGGATSIFAAGGGYYLTPNSRLDATYRLSLKSVNNFLYSGTSYSSNQALHQIALQYVVRF